MKKDIEPIKRDQLEIKNATSEINDTLQGINSRLDKAEDHISDLEEKVKKKIPKQSSKKKKEFLKIEGSLRNILDNMKHNNIHIMRISKGKENEQGMENLFEEITTKNFPNIMKEKDTHTGPGSSESQTSWTQRGLLKDTSLLK